MSEAGSVSRLITGIQDGDSDAATQLWQRYFHRVAGLALTKLRSAPRRVADEQDVAISVFDSVIRGIEQGRFPELGDREGLWKLLFTITVRKAAHLQRDQTRQKRGGTAQPAADGELVLEQILSREPTPEFAAQVAEEYERLLRALDDEDPELRSLAVGRMEGCSIEELVVRLDRKYKPRSIKRKLKLIRDIWEEKAGVRAKSPPANLDTAEPDAG